jgi:hypothetical protein
MIHTESIPVYRSGEDAASLILLSSGRRIRHAETSEESHENGGVERVRGTKVQFGAGILLGQPLSDRQDSHQKTLMRNEIGSRIMEGDDAGGHENPLGKGMGKMEGTRSRKQGAGLGESFGDRLGKEADKDGT